MPLHWHHPGWLWGLAALPLVWPFLLRTRAIAGLRPRVLSALLRSAVFAFLILALAQPSKPHVERRDLPASLVLVRDRSLSIASAAPDVEESDRRYTRDLPGSCSVLRIDFARTAEIAGQGPAPDPGSTNIELALERARAEIPAGVAAGVIVFTDGRATAGDAIRAAARLRAQGVSVHAVSIGQRLPRGPRILGIEPPPNPRLGQSAPFVVRVRSDEAAPFHVRLLDARGTEAARATAPGASGRPSGRESALVLRGIPRESGFQNWQVLIPDAGETPGEQTIASAPIYVEGPPRVLVLDTLADESRYLVSALRDTRVAFNVLPASAAPGYEALISYDAVVLNDCSEIDSALQQDLARYVRETGGGLLFIAGSNVRTQRWHAGVLEQVLPIEFLPEELKVAAQPRPARVCFVLDKSGSMQESLGQGPGGTVSKIDMVKAAVQRSIAELPPNATIAVVVFDATTSILVPPTPASGWASVSERVDSLAADGGTMMDTGIETGIALLDSATPGNQPVGRYMILLTDGLTNVSTGEPPRVRWDRLIARIRSNRISLTTIALGSEADRDLLNYLAWNTGGTSYDCQAADQVPKIFISEAQTIKQQARTTTMPFKPQPGPAASMIRGIPVSAFPMLAHALPSRPKSLSQVVLTTEKTEPLLAIWHEGLGTVVAFTSDAKPTWARQWVNWAAFGRFWSQALTWTLRSPNRIQAEVKSILDGSSVRLLVRATDDAGRPARGLQASGAILSSTEPESRPADLRWRETKPGLYEGQGTLTGAGNRLCRIQLSNGQLTVFNHGLLLNAGSGAELTETAPDLPALQAIASAGGGMVNPPPARILDQLQRDTTREVQVTRQFWPLLVLAAILLWLVDVAVRRLSLPSVRTFRAPGRGPQTQYSAFGGPGPASPERSPATPWQSPSTRS